jgi:hypothetical protein
MQSRKSNKRRLERIRLDSNTPSETIRAMLASPASRKDTMSSRERILTAPHLAELRRYLGDIRDLLSLFPLDHRWTPDGPSAGQIAFHAAEAADFWLRSVILGKNRPRDREAEFSRNPTLTKIREALDRATDACHLIEHVGPSGDQQVEVPEAFSPTQSQPGRWSSR